MTPLFQVDLRLARAEKHLGELESQLQQVEYTSTRRVTLRQDWLDEPIYTTDNEIERIGELELSEVQVVIDDFVHNLRAALNFLVVALAQSGAAIKLNPDDLKKLQFPIDDDEAKFREHRRAWLRGLREERVAMIEEAQPYKRCEWARLLRDLSNEGKRRGLVRLYHEAVPEPLSPDDEEELLSGAAWADVEVGVSVEVAFEDCGPVAAVLRDLQTQVTNFVEQFRRETSPPRALAAGTGRN